MPYRLIRKPLIRTAVTSAGLTPCQGGCMGKLANHARHWFEVLAAILVVSCGSIWGASWREINVGLPSAIAGASGLAIDPITTSTLYSWGSNGALFKSTDGAGSWNIVGGVAGVGRLVIDPENSSQSMRAPAGVLSRARMEARVGPSSTHP